MELKDSCLTTGELIDKLQQIWNIHVTKAEVIAESTALCRKIFSEENDYFLKEFQDSYSQERARLEGRICKLLLNNRLPVSEIIPSTDGKDYAVIKGRIFQLQHYVNGTSPTHNSLKVQTLCEASRYLGKIHSALRLSKLPPLFDDSWISRFNENESISFYKETQSKVSAMATDEYTKQKVLSDLDFRITLTKHMDALSKYFKNLTYTPSHGDYTPSQIICKGDSIQKIIDFSNLHSVPAVLELVRFYYLASDDMKCADCLNSDSLKTYIKSYLEEFKLTNQEIMSIPYVAAYYLGRNRYVYREYSDTGNLQALKKSAHLTEISRYFFNNAEEISYRLSI